MSMTIGPAGDADKVPSFLLRGPMSEVEPAQTETARVSIWQSSILIRSGSIAGAVAALSFGGYLMIAEGKQDPNASGVHAAAAQAVAAEAPVFGKSDEMPAVRADTPSRTPAPAAQAEATPGGGPEAPRQVTTTHFDADPSVWANVRKFSPTPADSAPAFETPRPEPALPAAASTPEATSEERVDRPERASQDRAARTEKRRHRASAGVKHEQRRHAGRHHRVGGPPQEPPPRPPKRAADETPSDVGGTKMTAEQLRRDGSANPVVNAFAGMFGPHAAR